MQSRALSKRNKRRYGHDESCHVLSWWLIHECKTYQLLSHKIEYVMQYWFMAYMHAGMCQCMHNLHERLGVIVSIQ